MVMRVYLGISYFNVGGLCFLESTTWVTFMALSSMHSVENQSYLFGSDITLIVYMDVMSFYYDFTRS